MSRGRSLLRSIFRPDPRSGDADQEVHQSAGAAGSPFPFLSRATTAAGRPLRVVVPAGAGLLDNPAELRFGFGDGPRGHAGHLRNRLIIMTIVVMLDDCPRSKPP